MNNRVSDVFSSLIGKVELKEPNKVIFKRFQQKPSKKISQKKIDKKIKRMLAEQKARNNLLEYRRMIGTDKVIPRIIKPIYVNPSKKFKRPDYRKYMKSKVWAKRRIEFYSKFGKECAICGKKKTQLHHMTYQNLGREEDDDLVALCNHHHDQLHQTIKMKNDMRIETRAFISEQKNLLVN